MASDEPGAVQAEKAGIVYVDVWDGFVDDAGKFTPQGPDYQGQTRRLRTSDGVHFTKFGARKLALYVEREIERSLSRTPVALPVLPDQEPRVGKDKPRAPAPRGRAGGASDRRQRWSSGRAPGRRPRTARRR